MEYTKKQFRFFSLFSIKNKNIFIFIRKYDISKKDEEINVGLWGQ